MNSPPTAEAVSPTHEKDLWRRLGEQRDQRAREELVALYLPMARRMASRYAGVVEPYDDLVQVASVGLLNAIDRFDPARGTALAWVTTHAHRKAVDRVQIGRASCRERVSNCV